MFYEQLNKKNKKIVNFFFSPKLFIRMFKKRDLIKEEVARKIVFAMWHDEQSRSH